MNWLKEILGEAFTPEIAKQVRKVISEEYVPQADYDALGQEKAQLEQEVKTRDSQIATLRKVDPAKLREEIARLQEQNKADKETYEAQLKQSRIDAGVELALVGAKARNNKAVRALLDLEKAELDEDGKTVKGLEKQLKKLMEGEDTGFLFHNEKDTGFVGLKAGESFRQPADRPDPAKMTYEQLAEYMAANPGAEI